MMQQNDIASILKDPEFRSGKFTDDDRIVILNNLDPDFAKLGDSDKPEALKQLLTLNVPDAANLPSTGQAQGIRGPLSSMEKAGAVLKQTARALPETAGMVLGGLGGAALGTPAGPPGIFAGAVTGATGGSAAGKGLEIALRNKFPGVFGGAESYEGMTPSAEIARAGSYGGVAEATGQGISNALPGMFERTLKPEASRRLSILEREGIPYTAADINPGGPAAILENLTRGTLLGSKVVDDSDVAQASKLYLFRKRVENSLGNLVSKEELGKDLQGAVESRYNSLFNPGGFFNKIYKRFDALYKIPIDTKQIRAEVMPIKEEIDKLIQPGRLPSASSAEAPSRFKALVNDLTKYGTKEVPATGPSYLLGPTGMPMPGQPAKLVEIPTTFEDVWKTKQLVEQTIRGMGADDPLRTQAKSVLQKLDGILDRSMEDAAQKASPRLFTQLRETNKLYKDMKELHQTRSMVADIANKDPEDIASTYFGPDQITPTRDLLRAMSPTDRKRLLPAIQRRQVQNMFDVLEKEFKDTPTISGKQLEQRMKRYVDSFEILFKDNPEKLQGIRDFIDASKLAQNTGTMVNPASGRQLLAYSQAGSALQWSSAGLMLMTGKDVGDKFLYESAILFGPRYLAKMLTNPKTAALLTKGFKISAPTANRIGWTPRVMNMLRIYKEAEEKEQQ